VRGEHHPFAPWRYGRWRGAGETGSRRDDIAPKSR